MTNQECQHRGGVLYRRKVPACKSRTGKVVTVDVYACGVKQRCTLDKVGLPIAGCNLCNDRKVGA